MPVVHLTQAPSREKYEAVRNHVDLDGDRPDDLIIHCASELPNGEVQILEVWKSAEGQQAFHRGRLLPALRAAGADPRDAPRQPDIYEPFFCLA